MIQLRWPDGKVKCPRCGAEKVTYLAKARVWKCYNKHKSPTFSLKTGTIFEDSPLGLDKWLAALWLVVNCKNGISSCEVARDLGITQKSAWFVRHRLRTALQDGGFGKLAGEIEIDETFIGGKARNMHKGARARKIKGTGASDKVAVMGLLERHGEVRAMVVPNVRRKSLHGQVTAHVEQGATVYSDALASYNGLNAEYVRALKDNRQATDILGVDWKRQGTNSRRSALERRRQNRGKRKAG